MVITVRRLIAQEDLGTRVIAGAGGLDREIGWAHVCELPAPWEWMGQGDLLMTTGMGIPASAPDQTAFVRHLASVGIAGVAVGENMNAPPLTEEMLAEAETQGLPLLLTRYEIPFIALARAVAEASAREDRRRMEQTAQVYELLGRSTARGLSLEDLLSSLEAVASCGLVVADPVTGRSRLRGRDLPEPVRGAVRRWAGRAHEDAPVILHLQGGDGVGVLMPGPRPAVLVALAREGGLPDSTVLRHMAAAAALQQTWLFAERERARRLGASLLAQLVDQRLDAPVATAQLREHALGRRALVLAACAAGEGELLLLHHTLDDGAVPHLMLTRGKVTFVLMPDEPKLLQGLLDALPAGSSAGLSDPFTGPDNVAAAQREARWALHRAQERRLPLVRHADDFGGSVFLPADRDDSRAAAHRVLGPLLEYDDVHASELVQTLSCFLEENRSWQRAAARLHVHRQTLVYRIRRIETLTGRSVSDTGDVAELWLGLQAAASAALLEQ
ncbi:MAG TPA: PucR family transcriptional regulator ligand-binding domain-containing protein [Nocardioidaceae bacterium]|jgi:purine catabolism regulator